MIALLSPTQGAGHGAEVVLGNLLRAWRGRGLSVVAPRGSAAAAMAAEAGAPFIPLRASRDALLANVAAANAALPALRGCELVHAWSARALELSWYVGRRLGVPRTATLHDHPDTQAQTPLRRRLWRVAANRQDAIAFPGVALERAWRSAGFRGASRVILNGSRRLPPRQAGPSRGDLVIGFLGMYAEWKGFPIAEAWARSEWPEHVRWAFYGETHPALSGTAGRLAADLGSRARFAGRQPPETIFSEVDVLVHCSTAFDPFPTVLIEAAQAGVPAVASALGGAGEIVVDGETGFLFDPAAPEAGLAFLRRLVADPDLRARTGGAARARFETCFTVERMAEEYAAFWEDALKMRR